ncbi:MAG TPA: sigma-70 family RNA polymerase sigma factor [Acidimicrobiia bacterium]
MNTSVGSEGRRQKFNAIADEVFEPLQRYLRRRAGTSDAEDALSEVMLAIWRRVDDAPSDRPLPWCYGIARRILANQRRSQSRHFRLIQRIEAEPRFSTFPDPAEAGPDPELAAALASLRDQDQEVLRLWAWEQLEPREIAIAMDVSVNAATLRLARAKKRLASHMSRQNRSDAGHITVEGTQESR